MLKKVMFLCLSMLLSLNIQAQQPVGEVEMADALRVNGMIYVVVLVVAVVMAGFIAYLIVTDRKVSRIEKELNDK